MPLIRRSVAAVALAAALLASGCSPAAEESPTAPETAVSGETPPSSEFPVTLEHVYGATEISEKPERVVALGWITLDVVAALGTAPVGVTETWGGDEEGFTPWFRDQVVNELSADMPQIIAQTDDGPDYEQILALQPDVILAPHSGITEVQYERLSEIAPTVAYAEQAWTSGSWQDLTSVVATALGEQDAAAGLVAETQQMMDDAAAAYPNLSGTSFLYGLSLSDGSTETAFYIPEDPRVAFLREFGLVDSPSLAEALGTVEEGMWYGGVSLENLDTIETDLYVAWSSSAEATTYTLEHPTFSRWEPIVSGNYYFLEDPTLGMATNGPNVLSIPWAIDEGFLEDLSAAVDGGAVVRGDE